MDIVLIECDFQLVAYALEDAFYINKTPRQKHREIRSIALDALEQCIAAIPQIIHVLSTLLAHSGHRVGKGGWVWFL